MRKVHVVLNAHDLINGILRYCILVSMLFASCIRCIAQFNRTTDTATVAKDIAKDVQSSYWYKLYIKERDSLNLKSIENGYKGLQVRIWIRHGYGNSSKNSSQLLIFDRSPFGDQGQIQTYLTKYNLNWDSIISIKKAVNSLIPKSGWINFWRKLEKTDIYYLPHYRKLFDYNIASDSDGVIVEIADDTKYRMYYYPDYLQNKDRIKEAGKFYRIMKMMEDEFGVKMIY